VYVTRIADDGALTVQFGDGRMGARPLSGRQNIHARYRQGTGLAGRVRAGQLSTLLDRPTGVKGVTNPIAADGGADPETLDGARAAAPGTVRTFGRAISRHDFEDTVLMNGEVARAHASWVWTGARRVIHLTVAGQDGSTFSETGLGRILATLETERDPNHPLLIGNYVPVAVTIDAALIVDGRHVASTVLAAARAALIAAFAFAARQFAEPVYLSDLYRVLQAVAGVTAVDVNRLDLKRQDDGFRALHGLKEVAKQPQPAPRLLMLPARWDDATGGVLPAELARVESPGQDIQLRTTGGLTG
jgi:predicted phage baseplate assembly protein